MASALVNNVGPAPDAFLDCRPPSTAGVSFSTFGWLSPRASFSEEKSNSKPQKPATAEAKAKAKAKASEEASGKDFVMDFEFRLEDPVTMLPADELFSDGKLVPLHLASVRPAAPDPAAKEIRSPDPKRTEPIGPSLDPYVFSPKAPRCSSRWRELLGLKKAAVTVAAQNKATAATTTSPTPGKAGGNGKGLKHFLHRNHNKSSGLDSSSLNLPLLRDLDSDSVSISARMSLSSSSSSGSTEREDLPRLSLDSDKPSSQPINLCRNPPRLRVSKPRGSISISSVDLARPLPDHPPVRIGRSQVRRTPEATIAPRGASVDSPRMNSYGKIVFQSLERSSSSPSTFNGGPRAKHHHRGMERSYSANVRVTPVLNVPVCSLRGSSKAVFGFGQLFSPQKKDSVSTKGSGAGGAPAGRNSRHVKECMVGTGDWERIEKKRSN